MATLVRRTSGTTLVELPDQTINTSATSLALLGRGANGYGQAVAENFVHILENFAATTAPVNPLTGQIWYDTTSQTFKGYNGSGWATISGGQTGGTVTSIALAAGTGLTVTGSPITTNGTMTVSLAQTSVAPGTYTYPTITVDSTGRITSASNGTVPTSPGGGTPNLPVLPAGTYTNSTITVNSSGFISAVTSGTSGPVAGPGTVTVATGMRQLWVRTDGSDSNDGSANSATKAFRTITAALSAGLAAGAGAVGIYITLGIPGTYDTPVKNTSDPSRTLRGLLHAAGYVIIEGNISSQDNYILSGPPATGDTGGSSLIHVGYGTTLHIRGVNIQNNNTTLLNHIGAVYGGQVLAENITYSGSGAGNQNCLAATEGGAMRTIGTHRVMCNQASFARADGGSLSLSTATAVTFNSVTMSWGTLATSAAGNILVIGAATFSGSVTGTRYVCTENGVIGTNGRGANGIPGTVAGVVMTGGVYT